MTRTRIIEGRKLVSLIILALDAKVYLNAEELKNVHVYIHLKGYSRATVTHLDIEHPKLNSFSYY